MEMVHIIIYIFSIIKHHVATSVC